ARGEGRGVLEEAVIEKRESPLDAVRHRHAVSLRAEEIRWQERGHLEPGRAGERSPARELVRQAAPQLLERVESIEDVAVVGRVEVLDPRREAEAWHVREERLRRVG